MLQGSVIKFASIGFRFALLLLITNLSGAELYGEYAFLLTVFFIVSLLSRFGFDLFIQKKISYYNSIGRYAIQYKYFSYAVFICIFSSSFLLILLYIISTQFHSNLLNNVTAFFWIVPSYGILMLGVFTLRALGEGMKSMLMFDLLFPFINMIAILLLVQFHSISLKLLLFSFGSSILILMLVLMRYLYKHFQSAHMKGVLNIKILINRFGIYPLLQSKNYLYVAITFILFSYTDIIILKLYTTDFIIGLYSVDVKIASLLLIPSSIVLSLYGYEFVQLYKANKLIKLKSLHVKLVKYLIVTGLILLIILFVFGPYIHSLFGDDFIDNDSSIYIILLVAYVIHVPFGTYETMYLMTGRERLFYKNNMYALLLNICFSLVLGYFYLEIGVAIATLISILYLRVFQYVELKYRNPIYE